MQVNQSKQTYGTQLCSFSQKTINWELSDSLINKLKILTFVENYPSLIKNLFSKLTGWSTLSCPFKVLTLPNCKKPQPKKISNIALMVKIIIFFLNSPTKLSNSKL